MEHLNYDVKRNSKATLGWKRSKAHDRQKSVDQFIGAIGRLAFKSTFEKKSIVFVTPHLRKHGGPTTIVHTANELQKRGHDVKLCCVHKDSLRNDLIDLIEVPLFFGFENISECDILFIPSDSDQHESILSGDRTKNKERIAAYSRVLASMSDLLDEEANHAIESQALEKLGDVYDSLVEARDLI